MQNEFMQKSDYTCHADTSFAALTEDAEDLQNEPLECVQHNSAEAEHNSEVEMSLWLWQFSYVVGTGRHM